MALVKIVDIDGVQWEMKDQTARDKITEQETKINSLQDDLNTINNKMYITQTKSIDSGNAPQTWFKIENTYPDYPYAPNVFLISGRQGAMYIMSCSREDSGNYWKPIILKLYDQLGKIGKIKTKEGIIYILSYPYNSIHIQQLTNIPKQIRITVEEPPEDATDITIIEK